MIESTNEQLSQPAEPHPQQEDQEAATYTHCIICHRGFKRPKTVPMGPVCAKKHAKKRGVLELAGCTQPGG